MKDKAVLVIDDQPEILEIIEEILIDAFDCEVVTAKNAVLGEEHSENKKFNVICTDFIMPGLSGVDFINFVRGGNGPNKDTPIVVLTGNEKDVLDIISEGPNLKILNKVEEINNIIQILSEYLKD